MLFSSISIDLIFPFLIKTSLLLFFKYAIFSFAFNGKYSFLAPHALFSKLETSSNCIFSSLLMLSKCVILEASVNKITHIKNYSFDINSVMIKETDKKINS